MELREQLIKDIDLLPDDVLQAISVIVSKQVALDRQEKARQLSELIKRRNIPHKTLEVNAEGHIVVDKDKDPELYDWAVNG